MKTKNSATRHVKNARPKNPQNAKYCLLSDAQKMQAVCFLTKQGGPVVFLHRWYMQDISSSFKDYLSGKKDYLSGKKKMQTILKSNHVQSQQSHKFVTKCHPRIMNNRLLQPRYCISRKIQKRWQSYVQPKFTFCESLTPQKQN